MTITIPEGTEERTGLIHPAVFYRSDEQYLDALVPFIEDGLAGGEPVGVAVPGDNLALLRHALGDDAARVTMIDMTEAGRNPGRILPAVLHAVADPHPDVHVRLIGEPIWAGRSATAYPACVQHEALINAAFATADVTIVCPYNAAELHPDVLDDALRTHPVLWGEDGPRHTQRFDPDGVYADYNQPLVDGSDIAVHDVSAVEELSGIRQAAAAHALGLGLARDRLHDLQYIVTELVTNSLVHTRNRCCQLRISRDSHHVICAVLDDGVFRTPLAGRRRPPGDQPGGRGLLMVNLLADLVRTHTGPKGTRIQAYLATG